MSAFTKLVLPAPDGAENMYSVPLVVLIELDYLILFNVI
ncbi:hypothetical protein K661_01103 [Piscirickettsia salmonis LF-89 = ATCC VR-1361]|nr:hypothetical protein K661_01103 [Piscirickettsia salmonis LF-89 = ATCC VR-1361]